MAAKVRGLGEVWTALVDRPKAQLVLAVPVSLWALAWVGGQFVEGGARWSPLDVLRSVTGRFGAPEPGWLGAVTTWSRDPVHQGLVGWLAVAAGLLWAATSTRAQVPALGGWLVLMVAGEGLGYVPAFTRAAAAFTGFVTLLTLISIPNRGRMIVRRIGLLPKDVLRAGAVAAALSLLVPLLAPGLALTRLLRPYLTRPARPDPSRRGVPASRVIPPPRKEGRGRQTTVGSPPRHGHGRAPMTE
ncbi:hypothetical protein NLX83_17710 [Allokutzneria sp. A3M-2-11 16]|uniref:hypothetical protein n=1 Tax=Allokutzneria sp. A3M-2-11 16 TaxID=2962043 RepID=UPI0020B7EF0F|nr:hypothetical protein [Allokutzneria sp. A3M-2-11 16]MCP3801100.1 hypothetical protein [Allokutzneria sp. A3M-2-11 16]